MTYQKKTTTLFIFLALFSFFDFFLLLFWQYGSGESGADAEGMLLFFEMVWIFLFFISSAILFFFFLLFGDYLSGKILKVCLKWIFIICPGLFIVK